MDKDERCDSYLGALTIKPRGEKPIRVTVKSGGKVLHISDVQHRNVKHQFNGAIRIDGLSFDATGTCIVEPAILIDCGEL